MLASFFKISTIAVLIFLISGIHNPETGYTWEIERQDSFKQTPTSSDSFADKNFIEVEKGENPASSFTSPSDNRESWNTVIDSEPGLPTASQKKEVNQASPPPPQILTQTAQITQPETLKIIDTLLAANQPAELPLTLYINNMTKVQYAGAVSMAMEGMRLFYGEMDSEQERLFEARWLPLFEYPSQEIVLYLNQLNPLLVQFLGLRAALNDSLENFNAAQLEVNGATQIGDASTIVQAMESAVLYATVNKVLNARLQLVGKEIIALGGPPNATTLRNKARKLHKAAIKEFFKAPQMTITPARLKAVAEKEYAFKIEIADHEKFKNDKISLAFLLDGKPWCWKKPEKGSFTIKNTFRSEIGTTHKITVKLQRYPGPKTLATVTAEIELIKDPGCWALVECTTRKDEDKNHFITHTIDKEERRIEGSFAPPSFVPQTLDRFNYLHTWKAPPQRLFPGAQVQIPVAIKKLHSCEGLNISTATYSKLSEAERTRLKVRTYNCSEPSATGVSWTIALSADELTNILTGGSGAILKAGAVENKALSNPYIIPDYDYNNKWFKNRFLWLKVEALDKLFHCEDAKSLSQVWWQKSASVIYGYKWDPSGGQLEPLKLGQGVVRPTTGPTGISPANQKKADKIIFHQHNIDHFTRNLKNLNDQLKKTKNLDAKNQLTRDLLYAEDARQREIDAITTIQTGEFVRTRTRLDALNMQIMANESRQLAEKWHTIKRIMERGPRLIDLAPENEREELRKFFNRHVTAENVVSGKSEKLSDAIKAIGDRVLGSIEVQIQAHQDEAQYWNENLEMAQDVKTFTDYSMMLLSFTGAGPTFALFGHPAFLTASGVTYQIYGATTGYMEGGWQESVSRTLSGFNAVTTVVDAGMRGYQNGVLQHLEEYARDPRKISLDEEKAGFKGAAWSAGTAAAFAVAIKLGTKAYQKRQQILKQKEAWRQLEYDLVKHDSRMRQYNRRFAQADVKIKTFEQRHIALSKAGQAGTPKEEIIRLRTQVDDAYKDIKTDWFAKTRMKALAKKGDFRTASGNGPHKTVHAYNSADRRFTKQLQKNLSGRMTKAGFNQQKFKTFSNSASKGGVGMDIDMGVIEPPRYKIVQGKQVPNPAHAKWRKGLTRSVNGDIRRTSPQEMQNVGNQEIKAAFEEVYGRKPGEAMVEFTTSYSPDAYRDPSWLGNKQSKTAIVHQTDPNWTQQASDVTNFKVNTLGKEHPSLGYYATMQENCRGMVKDMKTKLTPLLKKSKNPQAVKHMQEIEYTMEQFSTNQIGPLEAEHRLMELTGNKDGVQETAQRFSVMMQGLNSPAAQ